MRLLFVTSSLLTACGPDEPSDTSDTSDTSDSAADTDTGPVVIDDTADTEDSGDTEDTAAEEAAYEAFYDLDTVQTITLRLDSAAIAALQKDPDTYVSGAFEHDGTILNAVGIKVRGGESWDEKPGFTIKLQEFKGPEYAGLERIALDNQWDDSALVRAPLAYAAWRDAGLVAPKANFAEVYVNDDLFGVYANIEVPDEKFVARHYPAPTGTFWEGDSGADFYEQGTQFFDLVDGDEKSNALRLAWEAVQPPHTTSFYADTQAVIDMPQFFRYFAWSLAVGTNEGYPYEQNDFFVYADPTSAKLQFVPWALDQAWATSWEWEAHRGYLAVYCDLDPDCVAAMRTAATEVMTELDAADLGARAEELFAVTAEAVARDPRLPIPNSQVDGARDALVVTLDGWSARVRSVMSL
jgi:hypothetical protein